MGNFQLNNKPTRGASPHEAEEKLRELIVERYEETKEAFNMIPVES